MNLKDINLKSAYYSENDNLLEDFYIPALSNSIFYDRIAGYFSSNSLAISAKGISSFINNGGKIRLIANVILSEDDQRTIKQAIECKEKEILSEIGNIEDRLKENHIGMLGWMIKKSLLEIKIAIVKNGIEHQKIGIMEDQEGNKLSFNGSDNETYKGWLHNDEQFHVFCSWKDEFDHLSPDVDRFSSMWNNNGRKVKVYEVSQAFKEGLIKIAPKNDAEFKTLCKETTNKLLSSNSEYYAQANFDEIISLWDFQEEAIAKWRQNSFCGILSMATGTGKTRTATKGILDLSNQEDIFLCVVCCPQNSILKQWVSEISELDIFNKYIVADSTNHGWRHQLADAILDLRYSKAKIVVYTTYNTFSDEKFIEIIQKYNGLNLIVCDEVHWSGANTFQRGLLESYNYRLGLSATPERYMDDLGSSNIEKYFRGIVYEFPIERALKEINPLTGQTFLCPYIYYPIFVSMNDTELAEYFELTRKIKRRFAINRSKDEESKQLQRLLEERQRVITNAESKYTAFKKLLVSLSDISFSLTYCSPEQIDMVQEILKKKAIKNHRFTGKERTNAQKRYDGISEREYILNNFENGTYEMLVAMKCLDEGVNITRAETAILMASSGNPREYIQRRGRLLRRHSGKSVAYIYDIIVLPYLDKQKALNATSDEKKILKKELVRYEHFAESSKYPLEALNKIADIKKLYGLL